MTLSDVAMQRLPSGRHHLAREAVTSSQRRRLLAAGIQVIGERGWANTRVTDVIGAAGVSRKTFYELFANVEACFVEAIEVGLVEVLGALDRDMDDNADMALEERLTLFFTRYVTVLESIPGFPATIHVETMHAPETVREARARTMSELADRLRRAYRVARRRDPSLRTLPDDYFAMLVGGLDEIARERIRMHPPSEALDGYAAQATRLLMLALAGRTA